MCNTLYTETMRVILQNHIALYVFLVFTVEAAGQSYKVENISPENGLSNSWVSSILQDEEGFIWFGTWNGLNRYDGYDFTVFKPCHKSIMRR
jgi:ligand-binding sensor domain-containing protein